MAACAKPSESLLRPALPPRGAYRPSTSVKICEFYIMRAAPGRATINVDGDGTGRFGDAGPWKPSPTLFPAVTTADTLNTPRLCTSRCDARPRHGDVWSRTPTTPYPSRGHVR